ncbi:hypothetical protein PoHVEF18_008959 [Penicillium ochrochloron]
MDSELKKTIQSKVIQHAAVQQMPVHHAGVQHAQVQQATVQHAVGQNAAEGYKSNQQLKCTRTQRDIKQATGPPIQYRSVTWRDLSDTVTLLEQKCESLQDRVATLELNAQQSRDATIPHDETEDIISECESCFEFINLENEDENDNDQSGQDPANSCSGKDRPGSSRKEKGLADTFEERLCKNDTRVIEIKARIAKLLGDIDVVVREMKEPHEDMNSKLRQARDLAVRSQQGFNGETISPRVARTGAYGNFKGSAGFAGNHSG